MPLMRQNCTVNFDDAVDVNVPPVFDPTVNPENDGMTADAPALVSRIMHEPSAAGAVNDHADVDPVMY